MKKVLASCHKTERGKAKEKPRLQFFTRSSTHPCLSHYLCLEDEGRELTGHMPSCLLKNTRFYQAVLANKALSGFPKPFACEEKKIC